MISHGEVGLDAKQSTQGPPETGDEVLPTVRDDVGRGSMLRDDVYQEKHSKILGINIPMGHNEQCHFGETADNDQDGVVAI